MRCSRSRAFMTWTKVSDCCSSPGPEGVCACAPVCVRMCACDGGTIDLHPRPPGGLHTGVPGRGGGPAVPASAFCGPVFEFTRPSPFRVQRGHVPASCAVSGPTGLPEPGRQHGSLASRRPPSSRKQSWAPRGGGPRCGLLSPLQPRGLSCPGPGLLCRARRSAPGSQNLSASPLHSHWGGHGAVSHVDCPLHVPQGGCGRSGSRPRACA